MEILLFRKYVDQSLLKDGLTIKKEWQQSFLEAIHVNINKGENCVINVIIQGITYEARLTSVDFRKPYENRNTLQIRYSSKSPICSILKQIFKYSHDFISDKAETKTGKTRIIVEDEWIDVYAVGEKKLKFVCKTKLDPEVDENEKSDRSLKKVIEKFLNDYVHAKEETFGGNEFGMFVRKEIPTVIHNFKFVDKKTYLVTGSIGQGNWAMVPWVCIFDRRITNSATKGVYIVYLLSKDGKRLYLTLNQGCTDIQKEHTKKETIAILRERATEIISQIDSRGFAADEHIDLGDHLTDLGELYQKGTIFYKTYFQGKVPSEEELCSDLFHMVEIYKEYVKKFLKRGGNTWLLSWNPNNWEWKDFSSAIISTKKGIPYFQTWNCSNTHVQVEDRIFLTLLGNKEDNGIIASGYAESGIYDTEHWDPIKAAQGVKQRAIKVSFDWIIDYKKEPILSQEVLTKLFPKQHWHPQGSGIQIKEEYVDRLEEEWQKIRAEQGGEKEMSVREKIEEIKNYIEAKGFHYPEGMIENFYLSLKSKPFVILAGISGTGKTQLVKLFAEAIGATSEDNGGNGRYKLVPVHPDWSDSSDLFGHTNLKGDFVEGAIIDFVKRASLDLHNPYFLCFDEMNLARVEYYLSDFLSVMETRHRYNGKIVTDEIILDKSAEKRYGQIILPENLYVVGTVNMDETTFPFSKKVLDRANTIEFSCINLLPDFERDETKVYFNPQKNQFLRANYLTLETDVEKNSREFVLDICRELQDINTILEEAQLHIGYRVRDEIVFYLLNNKNENLLPQKDALDNEIMQKILPRIQGSSSSVKEVLCQLFRKFAGDYTELNQYSVGEQMREFIEDNECQYKRSAEKICYMMRRFEEDGFTSYWL